VASRTKKARPAKKGRALQAPTRRQPGSWRPWLWALAGAGAVAVVALVVGVAVTRSNGGSGTQTAPEVAAGLPNTPDYHSLMVSPTNAKALLLGTHYGLFRSTDGGRTWASDALGGQGRDEPRQAQRADALGSWAHGACQERRWWEDLE
jgi:hypothetical protein